MIKSQVTSTKTLGKPNLLKQNLRQIGELTHSC